MDIDAEWIRTLVEQGTPEGQRLEFKQAVPGKDDKAKSELLKDVVAMANAIGGQILYGIAEEKGRAARICDIGDGEGHILAMTQTISQCTEPGLRGFDLRPVEVDGATVLVLSVKPQFDGPYRTRYSGRGDFYYRQGAQVVAMTYSQIRDAFGLKDQLASSMRAWRSDRLGLLRREIASGVVMDPLPWTIVHVMPLQASTAEPSFDVSSVVRSPAREQSPDMEYNIDGIRLFNHPKSHRLNEYYQFFREGRAEYGVLARDNTSEVIGGEMLAYRVRRAAIGMTQTVVAGGVEGPVALAVAIEGVAGSRLVDRHPSGFSAAVGGPVTRTSLVTPEALVDDASSVDGLDRIVRQLLDIVWQGFGASRCPYFDGGKWAPRAGG